MTRCSLGNFVVVPTFLTRRLHICKAARDPSGKRWNYLSRRLSCNFALMTAFTPFRYLFLDLRTCICTNYCVSCLNVRPTACPCHVCFSIMTRAKWWNSFICEQHAVYLNWIRTKTRFEPPGATGIYSFVFISYWCWIWVRSIWRYKWRNMFNGILSKSRLYRLWSINTFHKWWNSYKNEGLVFWVYWKWAKNMTFSNGRKSGHYAFICDEEGMEESHTKWR